MKKLLLTSFGSRVIAFETIEFFKNNTDIELFISDANDKVFPKYITNNFIGLISAHNENYVDDLLQKAIDNEIDMIIPGADEECFELSKHKQKFLDKNIIIAVQDENYLKLLQSKSTMYDYLREKGLDVPLYKKVATKQDIINTAKLFNYPKKPIFIKPDRARGGRGVYIISEEKVDSTIKTLSLQDFLQNEFEQKEYILMEYLSGEIYDIDILQYENKEVFFGSRRRIFTVGDIFKGNTFDFSKKIIEYAKKIYTLLPTKFLIDYDILITEDNKILLIEVNPRPSGSTVSYNTFGYNLYYTLAKSYLFSENINIIEEELDKKTTIPFTKMIEINLIDEK